MFNTIYSLYNHLKSFLFFFFLERCSEPRIEIVDGFKPPSKSNENKLLSQSFFTDLPDFETIPGELELGEDGFKQVKPPRKSNKFIIQEFNRVESEEKTEMTKKSFEKSEKRQNITEFETSKANQSSRSRSLKKKNDNCAQQ